MSFISSQIKEAGYIHPLADDAADEIEQLESQITQLESQLAEAKKVISVVDSLVTAKGRYHTAQWYQKMVNALDEYKAIASIQEGK